MLEDLKKVISENLPEQVGKALKARLQEADEDKKNLESTRIQLKTLTINHEVLLNKNRAYEELNTREKELNNLGMELTIRERVIVISEKHAEEKVNLIQGLVKSVFENRQITRVQYMDATLNGMPPDRNGVTPYPSVSGTVETTQDEE